MTQLQSTAQQGPYVLAMRDRETLVHRSGTFVELWVAANANDANHDVQEPGSLSTADLRNDEALCVVKLKVTKVRSEFI